MYYESLEEALSLGEGREREFICPVHESNNAHASVNSSTGWWYCFSCGARGHADMSTVIFDPFHVSKSLAKTLAKMTAKPVYLAESYLNVYDSLGPGKYWLSRFDEATCRHYRLGQAIDGTYAITPMRNNDGELIGVIRRDLTGKDPAKYRYPPGINVGKYLFDIHRKNGPTLLLTEGATDSIACREAGADIAVATYGSNITREQVKLIHQYEPSKILCGYDQDAAGEHGYERLVDELGTWYPIERLWWEGYKDLASIPVDERREMLASVLPKRIRIKVAQTG